MGTDSDQVFRFSNWLGSGPVGLGMVGPLRSVGTKLFFQSSYLAPDNPPHIDLTVAQAWDAEDGLFLLHQGDPAAQAPLLELVDVRIPNATQ